MQGRPLLIGSDGAEARALAARLSADLVTVETTGDDDLERWRHDQRGATRVDQVVVACWPPLGGPSRFAPADAAALAAAAEDQIVRWIAALGVATARCSDGGAIVAVVDRPAPLDVAGRTGAATVADAVEALVRSLARSEGPRNVRVNAVTTPARTTARPVPDPAPPLDRFPGDPVADTVGVVRMLLAADASAVTGQVVNADSGRSWR